MDFWEQWKPLADQIIESLPQVGPEQQKYALANTLAYTFKKGGQVFAANFVHSIKEFREKVEPAERLQGGPLDGALVHHVCEAVIELIKSFATDHDNAVDEGYAFE